MQIAYEIVIADTTCFILLDKIGELGILKSLFGSVVTTTIIALNLVSLCLNGSILRKLKMFFFKLRSMLIWVKPAR